VKASGLSALWNRLTVTSVKLPMQGKATASTYSAAAAVLFYEALRQRQSRGVGDEGRG